VLSQAGFQIVMTITGLLIIIIITSSPAPGHEPRRAVGPAAVKTKLDDDVWERKLQGFVEPPGAGSQIPSSTPADSHRAIDGFRGAPCTAAKEGRCRCGSHGEHDWGSRRLLCSWLPDRGGKKRGCGNPPTLFSYCMTLGG
jgi:hypothetical protein